jgi:hypothetical protein
MLSPWAGTWLRRVVVIAFIGIAAIVFVRAYQVCSRTPDGWQLMREGMFAGLPPWFSKAPDWQSWDRARLELIERARAIESDPNATAEDCMGMAWLLLGNEFRFQPSPTMAGRMAWGCSLPNLSWDDLRGTEEVTEQLSQKLAAKATELEPSQVDWWRLRALLMTYRSRFGSRDLLDREALEQISAHDPENALCAYLIASEKLNRAFNKKEGDEGPTWFIEDAALLAEGKERYEAAAAKPNLLCGEQSYGCAAKLLAKLDAPVETKLEWANCAGFDTAFDRLVNRISLPIEDERLNDFSDAERANLQTWFSDRAKWLQQIRFASPTLQIQMLRSNSRAPQGQNWDLVVRRSRLLAEEDVLNSVARTVAYAGIVTVAMACMFLALALVANLIGLYLKRGKNGSHPVAILGAPLVFSAALAATFAYFGLGPTYQPSFEYLPRIVIWIDVVVLVAIAVLIGLLIRAVVRQAKLPRKSRGRWFQVGRLALALLGSLAFVIGLFSAVDPKFRAVMVHFVKRFPANVMPGNARYYSPWNGITLDWRGNLYQAVMEWAHRGGTLWTVGLTFAAILFWNLHKSDLDATRRERWAKALRFAGKSSAWVAAILLVLSVALTSHSIVELSQRYERDLTRLADYSWLGKMAEQDDKQRQLKPLTP